MSESAMHERPPEAAGPSEGPVGVGGVGPWFALLGGAAAWALHLVVAYGLSEIACRSDRLDVRVLGLDGLELFGYTVTLLAALTAIAAALVAVPTAPERVRTDPVDETGGREWLGRQRFVAYVGVVMNGLFTLAILGGGLPFLFLRTCG